MLEALLAGLGPGPPRLGLGRAVWLVVAGLGMVVSWSPSRYGLAWVVGVALIACGGLAVILERAHAERDLHKHE